MRWPPEQAATTPLSWVRSKFRLATAVGIVKSKAPAVSNCSSLWN